MTHAEDPHSRRTREPTSPSHPPANFSRNIPTAAQPRELTHHHMAHNPSLPNSPPDTTAPSRTFPTPVLVPEWPTHHGLSHTSSSATTTPTATATTPQPSSSTRTSATAGTGSASKKSNGDGDDLDDLDAEGTLPNPGSSQQPHNDQMHGSGPDAPPGTSEAEAERRRRRREERHQRRKEEANAARELELENDARRLFRCGFFALPLLWLLSLFYFHREFKDENASDQIKKCTPLTLPFSAPLPNYFLVCQTMISCTCLRCAF